MDTSAEGRQHTAKFKGGNEMDKSQMANHIKANYKNIQQSIMLAQLDYLKNGKFYGWNVESNKFRLINYNGNYKIESV